MPTLYCFVSCILYLDIHDSYTDYSSATFPGADGVVKKIKKNLFIVRLADSLVDEV